MKENEVKIPAYIFDLDGVLADNSARQKFLQRGEDDKPSKEDWVDFYRAIPLDGIYEDTLILLRTLQAAGNQILILTGRSEDYSALTMSWLTAYGISPNRLYQRRHNDFRKDWEIKKEIFLTEIRPYYKILGVFEDRRDCVELWRNFQLTCYQPREANY